MPAYVHVLTVLRGKGSLYLYRSVQCRGIICRKVIGTVKKQRSFPLVWSLDKARRGMKQEGATNHFLLPRITSRGASLGALGFGRIINLEPNSLEFRKARRSRPTFATLFSVCSARQVSRDTHGFPNTVIWTPSAEVIVSGSSPANQIRSYYS